ncbi:glycoside hydrolase family 9 protein [Chitinophaga sp. 22321]|uniref:Endoglucanase n=1 Tax=Chitinophaga hostae TaxID=2831022 RepID=A0ABS5J4X9_9BACT|nr:glycoside hydrolase family 9 protein [Chitinophaga hostae]MBS0030281.1 glycoside hydrolase family 9 protein [Chitinophaga hostae]
MLRNKPVLSFLLSLTVLSAYAQSSAIQLNQCGFYPYAPKIAVVTVPVTANRFYIVQQHDTVFRGMLGNEQNSAWSATKTRIADFSALTKPGRYKVVVPGVPSSYVFTIGNDVQQAAGIASLKGYYYQRTDMPLEERFAGQWRRAAGHPDTRVLVHAGAASPLRPAGTVIATPGGWFDAGDYNKYIVNSGITMGTLLSAYEDFPGYFKQLPTNIPESADAIPDILNEVIYNLRWMLTMQDPADGGVYNKCTNAAFDGMVMPGVTKAPRYVVQKGTAATLDFAAVAAQAARVLKTYDAELADSCSRAAVKAWGWALQFPALAYNQDSLNKVFQPAITTGPYGDRFFQDEWLWAAAELYLSTRDPQYLQVVQQRIGDPVSLPAWSNVGMLAYYSFLRSKDLPTAAAGIAGRMKQRLLALANGYVEKESTSAFRTVMGQTARDFIWGSNSVAANQGIVLLNAYMLTRDQKYINGALTNLDYLLGRNATGYCFLTGIGSKSPVHPHHRPSVADGIEAPVPGLLVAGPNPGMQDKCHYEFTAPETAYADIDCAYASNEIAINWNAPMVYLANGIEALKQQAGYVHTR